MRFIYTDEAGTSADEPVTVVIGLIVNADTQWLPAVAMIDQVLSKVPQKHKSGFVFHAKSVWGSQKYRPDWSMQDRMTFLMEMMAVPRAAGIAISYGLFYRDGVIDERVELQGMTPVQYQHVHAFGACMAAADQYITTFASANEVAAIVAENIPEMHSKLKEAASRLRTGTLTIRRARITQEVQGQTARNEQPVNLRIRRVVDDIHFAPRESAPLLWAADAVAFGLRRYYANQSHGMDFGKAVIGPDASAPQRNMDCALGYLCSERPPQFPFPGAAAR